MIVIDVETTGTNSQKHSLVNIGAVDTDDLGNIFYEECRIWEGAHIEEIALEINGETEESIKDPSKQTEGEIVRKFLDWFEDRKVKVIVGHNPILDFSFIRDAADRADLNFTLSKRTIDLHTVCFTHMVLNGKEPPLKEGKTDINSETVMEYVGIPKEPKPHKGINGAIWEAEALYRLFYNKNLFEQFSKYPIPWI